MITTTLLATTAPVWIAPAMNVHMYENKIVQKYDDVKTLGYTFIEPEKVFSVWLCSEGKIRRT